MFRGYWIVADMDGTLVSTPSRAGGKYLSLAECPPCRLPLVRWIEGGGSLCAVSTAGRRMWRQIHTELRTALTSSPQSGRLALCGFSGAAFFLSSASGEMVEDRQYRSHAVPTGTVMDRSLRPIVEDTCQKVIYSFLEAASTNERLISSLSKKYHEPYRKLVAAFLEQCGGNREKFASTVLPLSVLKTYGAILTETEDALLDMQFIPQADGSAPPEDEMAVAQYTVMGIPMAHFEEFFTPTIVQSLNEMGLYVKKQPNSVVVAKQGVDKASCVRWMLTQKEELQFELSRAIAFGDVPKSIDRPLTQFPPMAFVSVSPIPADDPEGVIPIGNEENGTAAFLTALIGAIEESKTFPSSFSPVVAKAKKTMLAGVESAATTGSKERSSL